MALQLRRTKIIATLGPATDAPGMLERLLVEGVDVVRLNLSHGDPADHKQRAATVRKAAADLGREVAVLADLQGPKIRIERFAGGPVQLEPNQPFTLDCREDAPPGDATRVGVSYHDLWRDVKPGDVLLLDDGLVSLEVVDVANRQLRCSVLVGGRLSDRKGINRLGGGLTVAALSDKDRADIVLSAELEADFLAVSFVKTADDIEQARKLLKAAGGTAALVAKIERAEAIENLAEIVEVSDAVMVARGDLGVEIGAATVPLLQKRIILHCLEAGKPVITATQMLESMTEHAEPTRAEASDVANAVLDGTSAVMLSAETATGNYPVAAVQTMDRIARAVEPSMGYRHQTPRPGEDTTVGRAMSNAACDLAETLGASAILVPTFTGRTASAVARLRPHRPIVGLSHHQTAVQQMALEWGVTPVLIPPTENVEDLWARSLEAALTVGVVETGDRVVTTAGTAVNLPGSTNVIKVDIA